MGYIDFTDEIGNAQVTNGPPEKTLCQPLS